MDNSTEMNVNEVNEIESGEQTEVVEQSSSHNSDFDIIDDQVDIVDPQAEAETKEESKEEAKPKQSREDNHAAKNARLRAEREAKEMAEKMFNERIRNSGAINPYTEKPFESLKEFEEYGRKVKEAELKERAENEGKSVEDLLEEEEARIALQEKRQKESEDAEKAKQIESEKNFFEEDLKDFMERFPEVDIAALDSDEKFRRFCGSRYGHEPLANLFSDYKEIFPKTEHKDTRSERATGSGDSGGTILTTQQRKDLDEWNRQNPDMKMTPREFVSR